ncbi:MAG: 3-dehydroquinate synthase, partial [Actinomycetota bacterium]|nr:3-dehydroquinate synthase [Actinomycetota bacterium]
MIALAGFMGAGKTTVGRILATRLRLPFVDVDAMIEARAGTTIAALFEERGESEFRRLESETLLGVLNGPDAVVALGGGSLGDPSVTSALEWATVVHLDVSFREATRRLGGGAGRPMLRRADPKGLYDARRATYVRVADHRVAVDGRTPEEIAEEIAALIGAPAAGGESRIAVSLGDRSYDVIVGTGLVARTAELVPIPADAEKAFVVTHPELEERAAEALASLSAAG